LIEQTAFIPYITAGDPDLATTAAALRLLDACGADVIELGVPCSDPYADGPVIQASTARALAGGVTLDGVLAMLKEVTPELSCPVVLFSYFKPVMERGMADFAAAVKEAGARGLLVPDLPHVATSALRSEAIKNNLELVGVQVHPAIFFLNTAGRFKKAIFDMNNGCIVDSSCRCCSQLQLHRKTG
jgi:indole-3-glycerol-phosphate lyase